MSPLQGIGTCLVPRESGVPCGRQIDEGESIGTITLPAGGAVIGHKDCVSAYHTRKGITPKEQEQDVVKRADQQGPGGPVDMTKSTDAIQGSIPLEKSPTSPKIVEDERIPKGAGPYPIPSLSEVKMPEGVVPVSTLPMREPVDRWADGHVEEPLGTDDITSLADIPTLGNVSGEILTDEEREILRKFRTGTLAPLKEIITWTTELVALLSHHGVDCKAPLVADLVAWKQL